MSNPSRHSFAPSFAFDNVLKLQETRIQFSQFLQKECNQELILFWEEVQNFRLAINKLWLDYGIESKESVAAIAEDFSNCANKIRDKFLLSSSEHELNISHQGKETTLKIINQLQQLSKDGIFGIEMKQQQMCCFDLIEREVCTMLHSDVFPRFIRSEEWHKFLMHKSKQSNFDQFLQTIIKTDKFQLNLYTLDDWYLPMIVLRDFQFVNDLLQDSISEWRLLKVHDTSSEEECKNKNQLHLYNTAMVFSLNRNFIVPCPDMPQELRNRNLVKLQYYLPLPLQIVKQYVLSSKGLLSGMRGIEITKLECEKYMEPSATNNYGTSIVTLIMKKMGIQRLSHFMSSCILDPENENRIILVAKELERVLNQASSNQDVEQKEKETKMAKTSIFMSIVLERIPSDPNLTKFQMFMSFNLGGGWFMKRFSPVLWKMIAKKMAKVRRQTVLQGIREYIAQGAPFEDLLQLQKSLADNTRFYRRSYKDVSLVEDLFARYPA